MTVEVQGSYPVLRRKRTGLFSLDSALADKRHGILGFPMRVSAELYGKPNVGKSSLAYYLAARLTEKGRVAICDIENADPDYIKDVFEYNGFDGKVWMIDSAIPKKEVVPLIRLEGRKSIKPGTARYHEEMIMDMLQALNDPDTGAVILDSVGAVQSLDEQNGDLGEAFWGKRAKLMGQVSRALSGILRNKETQASALIINHVLNVMGGKGHTTPGGDTKSFLAAVRMMLWTGAVWKLKEDDPDAPILGFEVAGQVEKLRFGGRGRQFGFFVVPGYGVHQGASAMFDCLKLGLAEAGSTVKVNGKSLGYIRKDLLSYAASGKERKFDPFRELLADYEVQLGKEMPNDDGSVSTDEEGSDDLPDTAGDDGGTEGAGKGAKKRAKRSAGGGR